MNDGVVVGIGSCPATGQGPPTGLTCPAAPSVVQFPSPLLYPLPSGSCIYVPGNGSQGLFVAMQAVPGVAPTCPADLYVIFTDPTGATGSIELNASGVYYTNAGSSTVNTGVIGSYVWANQTPPTPSGLWFSIDASGTLNSGTTYWNDTQRTFQTALITSATGFMPNGIKTVVVGPQVAAPNPNAWSLLTLSVQPYSSATGQPQCIASGWTIPPPMPTPTVANITTPGSALVPISGPSMTYPDHAADSCPSFFASFQYTVSSPTSIYYDSNEPVFVLGTDAISWNNPLTGQQGSQPWVAPTYAQLNTTQTSTQPGSPAFMYLLIQGDSLTVGLGSSPDATTGTGSGPYSGALATVTIPGLGNAAYILPLASIVNTTQYAFDYNPDSPVVSPYSCSTGSQPSASPIQVPPLASNVGWILTGTISSLVPASSACTSGWPWSIGIQFSGGSDATSVNGPGVLNLLGNATATYQPTGIGPGGPLLGLFPSTSSSAVQSTSVFLALDGTTGDLMFGTGSQPSPAPAPTNVAFQVPAAYAPSLTTSVQTTAIASGQSGVSLTLDPSSLAPWPTPPPVCPNGGSAPVPAQPAQAFPASAPSGSTYFGSLQLQTLVQDCDQAAMSLVFYGSTPSSPVGTITFTSPSSLEWSSSSTPSSTSTTVSISPPISTSFSGAYYSWSLVPSSGVFSLYTGATGQGTLIAQFNVPWAQQAASIGAPLIAANGSAFSFTIGSPSYRASSPIPPPPPPVNPSCSGGRALAQGNTVNIPWPNASAFTFSLITLAASCPTQTSTAGLSFIGQSGGMIGSISLQSNSLLLWKNSVSNTTGTVAISPALNTASSSLGSSQPLWLALSSGNLVLGTGSIPLAPSTVIASAALSWVPLVSGVFSQSVSAGQGGFGFTAIQPPIQITTPILPSPTTGLRGFIDQLKKYWAGLRQTEKIAVYVTLALIALLIAILLVRLFSSSSSSSSYNKKEQQQRLLQNQQQQQQQQHSIVVQQPVV